MNTQHPNTLEEQLRAAAPSLPPALKARTLARCASQSRKTRSRREQGFQRPRSSRLVWALAGMWVLQWFVVALLDSQHTTMLASTSAAAHPHYAQVSVAKPPVDLWRTLQVRSQILSGLMANRGEWMVSPEAG